MLPSLQVRIGGDASDLKAAVREADAAIDGLADTQRAAQVQATALTTSLQGVGAGSRLAGHQARMMGMQLSQVAQQTMATGNFTQALAIQLPDMAMGFGLAGMAAGTLAGVALPFVVSALMGTSEEVLTLEERLESLGNMLSTLQQANEIMAMSVGELSDRYGVYADQVLRAAESLALLQAAEARANLSGMISDLDEVMRLYTRTEATLFGGAGTSLAHAMARAREELGLTTDAAYEFVGLMESLESATTFDDQAAALNQIGQFLRENNVDLAQIPPVLRAALIEANQLAIAVAEVATEAERAAAAAQGMTFGVGFNFNPDTDMPPMPAAPAAPRRRGGGGGGAPRENPLIRELEALRNHLMTAAEIEIEAFEQRQQTLVSALEQRLITQAEYNERMEQLQRDHAATMASLDAYRYGTGLDQAEQFFGDMADALAGGNEKMMRAAKAFAAAEALINAWRAYSQVMADPSLPWFAKIPAALKVLAAGMQAVNAIKGGGRSRSGGGGGAAAGGDMASGMNPLNVNVDIAGDYIRPGQISAALMTDQIMNELRRRGVNMNVNVSGARP